MRLFAHSNEKVKNFQCSSCEKQFFASSKLTRHINTVHLDLRLYKCHLCNKEFKYSQDLKIHINDGHQNAKYFCPVCDIKLNTRKILNEHMHRAHKTNKIKVADGELYRCDICEKIFSNVYSIRAHKKKSHNRPINIWNL